MRISISQLIMAWCCWSIIFFLVEKLKIWLFVDIMQQKMGIWDKHKLGNKTSWESVGKFAKKVMEKGGGNSMKHWNHLVG